MTAASMTAAVVPKIPTAALTPTTTEGSSARVRSSYGSKMLAEIGSVHNSCVDALLTDFYQITMAYAYWKTDKHEQWAVFDAYFRKCPFKGEYCVAAGQNEVVRFLNTFGFSASQIEYLKEQMPTAEPAFFDYLAGLDTSKLIVFGMREGEIVFPNEPLLRIEGPLILCQLLETTLLNLLNFPCLITTNAARYRQVATASNYNEGPKKDPILIEMGTRRAQGPDGAFTASRYAYLGGFDSTSNVKAGHAFGIPIKGIIIIIIILRFFATSTLRRTFRKSFLGFARFPEIFLEGLNNIAVLTSNMRLNRKPRHLSILLLKQSKYLKNNIF